MKYTVCEYENQASEHPIFEMEFDNRRDAEFVAAKHKFYSPNHVVTITKNAN